MVDKLESNIQLLSNLGSDEVFEQLQWAFHFAVLSTKHPGFAEEKEWRVVYSPNLFGSSDFLLPSIKDVSGVPQKIYELILNPYAPK